MIYKNKISMQEYTLILNFYNKSIDLMLDQCELIRNQSHKPIVVIACFLGKGTDKLFLEYIK